MYLKLKYGDFLLIDIVYENGPIKFFCISAVLMLDVSIDTGLRTFLHLISICKYDIFVVFDVFDRQGDLHAVKPTNVGSKRPNWGKPTSTTCIRNRRVQESQNKRYNYILDN